MKNIVIALTITIAAFYASMYMAGYEPSGFMIVGFYLLLYFLLAMAPTAGKVEEFPEEAIPDRADWPLPGPLSKLGKKTGALLFMSIFWITNVLSLLNPFQLSQIIRQMIGIERLKAREKETGDTFAARQTKTQYCLPFHGEWLVYNGGNTPQTSHSWDILGQRFALDFVKADEAFMRHSEKGTRPEDYYCYGQEILAASHGTVVSIENRISDAPFIGYGFCDFTARSFIGSHVIIQHAEDEYGLYAHLVKGSVSVQTGDEVRQGQVIGRCGHSGHSSEPHLHFHLQDSPDLFNGMGLPVIFSRAKIDGEDVVNSLVKAGQRVKNTCR